MNARQSILERMSLSVDEIVEAMRRRNERVREINETRAERMRLIKRGEAVPDDIEAKARGEQ